ncbi:DUF6355 family natural product biosynthesis protein [Nocardiopsis dassonvillei]|uniref:DUF6355 family natural product biosynthesis protein n=1 Tax=Nocardiopsis dassonvillei TaxID=2014 RepID=UPI00366DE6D0
MKKALLATASAGLMAAGLFAASPASAETSPQEAPAPTQVCGYYETAVTAWYNHCGNTNVWVYIDYTWPKGDRERCLPPGRSDIGGAREVTNAWYTGRTC